MQTEVGFLFLQGAVPSATLALQGLCGSAFFFLHPREIGAGSDSLGVRGESEVRLFFFFFFFSAQDFLLTTGSRTVSCTVVSFHSDGSELETDRACSAHRTHALKSDMDVRTAVDNDSPSRIGLPEAVRSAYITHTFSWINQFLSSSRLHIPTLQKSRASKLYILLLPLQSIG